MVWLESLSRLAYRTGSKAAPAEPAYDVSNNAITAGSSVAGVELVTAFASMLRQASPDRVGSWAVLVCHPVAGFLASQRLLADAQEASTIPSCC